MDIDLARKPILDASLAVFRLSASASYGTGTTQVVPYDIAEVDPGNNFDISNGRYTAPESGVYLYNYMVACSSGGTFTSVIATLRKNGANEHTLRINQASQGTVVYDGWSGSVILSAGDYIDLTVGTASSGFGWGIDGGIGSGGKYTFGSIYRVA